MSYSADYSLVGVGLYSIPDAARFVRESSSKFSRWAQGYTFRRGDEQRRSAPLFHRENPELVELRILTFADLIELKIIGVFRRLNISMQTIRQAALYAQEVCNLTHPFAHKPVHTDGVRIFADWVAGEGGEQRPLVDLKTRQVVFDDLARPFFQELDYEADVAQRYWPLGRRKSIVLDPTRCFGRPVDNDSGVPTHVLYQMVEGGSTPEQVAWWYGVKESAVSNAVEFERVLLHQ